MISIIIPAYNIESYLEQCLQSIADQSYADFEAIVVDDGSTDATLECAQRFVDARAAAGDARFTVLSCAHASAGFARNEGLARARGDYLLFFDGDDYLLPNMLELTVRRAEETQADVVECRAFSFLDGTDVQVEPDLGPKDVDPFRVYSGYDLSDRLFSSIVGWPWDKLFRARFVAAHNLQFQNLSSTNDAYFVFVGLVLAERIAFVNERLVAHRKHAGSIERRRAAHNAKLAFEAIRNRLQREECWPAVERSCLNWGVSHAWWNFNSLTGDDRGEAIDDYIEALGGLAGRGEAYYRYPLDAEVAAALGNGEHLQRRVVELVLEKHLLQNGNESAIGDLQRQIAELTVALEKAQGALRALEGSTSYKAGRAMTALPRKARDAVRGRRDA